MDRLCDICKKRPYEVFVTSHPIPPEIHCRDEYLCKECWGERL